MTFIKSTRPHFQDDAETWREQAVAPSLNGYDMRQGEAAAPTVLVETNEPLAVSENQRAEVRLTDYARQLVTGGGHPGQGYPAVLTSSTAGSRARTCPWPASGPVFGASAAVSGMNSTGSCASCGHDGSSLKMFPDSLALAEDETSALYSRRWMTSGMAWRGEFWMRGGSESPSGGEGSSLSAVLETDAVPRKYWLSAKAAAGILRRAAKRGKELPPRLQTALESLAASVPTTATSAPTRRGPTS